MRAAFRSEHFIFRPGTIAARLIEMGVKGVPLIRDAAIEITARRQSDRHNVMASKTQHVKPELQKDVPGSRSWLEARAKRKAEMKEAFLARVNRRSEAVAKAA